jgi:hypothetical protein
MEDRVVDMLFFVDEILEMLFLGDDILEMDRLRARYSADFLVCERALWGILGTSSSLACPGEPK